MAAEGAGLGWLVECGTRTSNEPNLMPNMCAIAAFDGRGGGRQTELGHSGINKATLMSA